MIFIQYSNCKRFAPSFKMCKRLSKMLKTQYKVRLPCVILSTLIFIAVLTVCIMVKFATEISVDDKLRDDLPGVFRFKNMGLIRLSDNSSLSVAERFPYVAAITRNSTNNWEFACFASVILFDWIVTSAHCRHAGSVHRVLLYSDFVKNHTNTYPVLFWRLHEKYDSNVPSPNYDIAVAKLTTVLRDRDFMLKSAGIDEFNATGIMASVWKTVSAMDKRMYLTTDFEKFPVKIAPPARCFESYGIYLDTSLFCVDLSDYEDCFVHEFGPIYSEDNVAGIMAVKPRDCETKLAIFTNVSHYSTWILKSTHMSLQPS